MFEGLCVVATLGSAFLFMCGLSEAIELNEQKDRERKEAIRQSVYASKHREWQKKQNRRILWAEVTGNDDYLN